MQDKTCTRQRDVLDLAAGKWLRFDRYEVRNDCIAPAPGAKSRVYDPWALEERPYESLAQLVPSSKLLSVPARNPALVSGVLDWCQRYGLLGTLIHQVIAVTLWPRWERVEFKDRKVRDVFQLRQDTYVRLAGAWLTHSHMFGNLTDKGHPGQPAAESELPEGTRASSALLMEVEGSALKEEPIERTWGEYFPDVPIWERRTFPYPAPVGPDFWSQYGEPIWEFVRAAWVLGNGLEAITKPADSDAPRRGAFRLTQLASDCAPTLKRGPDGKLAQQWVAGSLLSSLALMAMQDLAQQTLYGCERCGRLFRSDAYQAKYCSARCRHTMQKRAFRQRQRERQRKAARKRARARKGR